MDSLPQLPHISLSATAGTRIWIYNSQRRANSLYSASPPNYSETLLNTLTAGNRDEAVKTEIWRYKLDFVCEVAKVGWRRWGGPDQTNLFLFLWPLPLILLRNIEWTTAHCAAISVCKWGSSTILHLQDFPRIHGDLHDGQYMQDSSVLYWDHLPENVYNDRSALLLDKKFQE